MKTGYEIIIQPVQIDDTRELSPEIIKIGPPIKTGFVFSEDPARDISEDAMDCFRSCVLLIAHNESHGPSSERNLEKTVEALRKEDKIQPMEFIRVE